MEQINKESLYRQAERLWGMNAQMDMLVEESAELIQAVNKVKRRCNEQTLSALYGEIADVEIMIEQAKLMLACHGDVETAKQAKLARLKEMIDKQNSVAGE